MSQIWKQLNRNNFNVKIINENTQEFNLWKYMAPLNSQKNLINEGRKQKVKKNKVFESLFLIYVDTKISVFFKII
jgi:hypothetical protein